MSESLRFDATRLVQETVEDAVLVIDVAAGHCYALDGGAAALWPALLAGTTREALLRHAEAVFDASPEIVRPAVEAFLADLLAARLVVAGNEAVAALPLPDSRQAFEAPRLKRHDDLDELLGDEDGQDDDRDDGRDDDRDDD